MSEGKMLKNMPTDIILNIQSFLLGEPHLYKIKRNTTLKAIQNKYKINYTLPLCDKTLNGQTNMEYSIWGENLKPHMIITKKNLNRIVNFINHFQWGLPYGYDSDYELEDEVVDDIDLDENADDLSIENDDIKVLIELTSLWNEKLTHHEYGDVYNLNRRMEQRYLLETISVNTIQKSMRHFASKCYEYEVENNTGVKQSKMNSFIVSVFIRSNEYDSDED